jgi:simple sugar transport system substrate-binding protein/ribose transport system substrate-binding protein
MPGRTAGKRNRFRIIGAVAAVASASLALTACGSTEDTGSTGSAGGDGTGKVGVILPLLTSPFWQSYNDYVPRMAESEGVETLKTVNSNSDPSQQIDDPELWGNTVK